MQWNSNNHYRPFSTSTSSGTLIYGDNDIIAAKADVVANGATPGTANPYLYNSLSRLTTMPLAVLTNFIAKAPGNSITFGMTTNEDAWEEAFNNFFADLSVKNVTTSINSQPITSIFEDDGTTVKNATNANRAMSAEEADAAILAMYASHDTSKGTIEERLTALGFKQGVVEGSTLSDYTLTRQGNYVIGQLHFLAPQGGLPTELCTLPINFRPKAKWTTNSATMTRQGLPGNVVVTIDTDGKVTQPNEIYLWIDVTIGFEAPPIL